MKFKNLLLMVLTLMLTGLLVACNNEDDVQSNTYPVNTEETSGDVELSGSLTVYLPAPTGLADDLIAAFEAQTGISIAMFQGTTGEILARLEAEAANPIADVVILASWSDGLILREQGGLLEFRPEYAELLHDGFISDDNTLIGTSASAVGIAYNTLLIDELSADWHELANDSLNGQAVFPDPALSGSANDFLAGFMYHYGESGWDVWDGLAVNNMVVLGANAASLESVITGERGVLVSGVDWNVFAAIERGEPLGFYYPTSGTVINPRPAMILESTQNLENAQAFINFLLSDEAQQMVIDAYLIPSRSDMRSDRRPNVDEINVLNTNWDWMMNNANEISNRFNELFQ